MTSNQHKQSALCGAWPSPISAAMVAAGAAPLSQVVLDGADAYWLAGRASESGRNTLLRQRGQDVREMTPAPFNVRTRVHEYGGGALLVADGTVIFSNFADNRLYMAADGADPVALGTGAGSDTATTARYADFVLDHQRQRLIAVREEHAGAGHPVNTVCAVGVDGSETVLVEGGDFYAAPRISPDGRQLAWLSWNHPNMPWQGTELWLAEVDAAGALSGAHLVAGGIDEAVCQPEWSPGGVLHFVSDRGGWWNLYRFDGAALKALCPRDAEFGVPHWAFGGSMYGFRSEQEIICTYIENGVSRLAQLSVASGTLAPIANPYQEIRDLRVAGSVIALLGGAPTIALELARIDLSTGELAVLARSITNLPNAAELSVPESTSYPTSGGRHAHAFYYPPCNAGYEAAPGAKPPLMVISHGGPTGMASNTLKLATQYWTSRGFAVLDVNYGGSSGFGRAYRDALKGQWGVIDVDDCVAGARHLSERGMVDAERLVIRGGSAGGLTTLCALTFHDGFKAGASYYGVSDLKGLDDDSHKFESHYNEYLIAPKAQAASLYQQRSPIH
ncbi:MAG: S9 family peptidase, partial [Massilia sp.]|nr:S9 family peptidase [Massilia sp.]